MSALTSAADRGPMSGGAGGLEADSWSREGGGGPCGPCATAPFGTSRPLGASFLSVSYALAYRGKDASAARSVTLSLPSRP
jgi:hypothetical protein